jgi:hypothetical protein
MFSDGEAFYVQKGRSLSWSPIDDQMSPAGQFLQKEEVGHPFSVTQKRERRKPF